MYGFIKSKKKKICNGLKENDKISSFPTKEIQMWIVTKNKNDFYQKLGLFSILSSLIIIIIIIMTMMMGIIIIIIKRILTRKKKKK